jgi:hypothetical protein
MRRWRLAEIMAGKQELILSLIIEQWTPWKRLRRRVPAASKLNSCLPQVVALASSIEPVSFCGRNSAHMMTHMMTVKEAGVDIGILWFAIWPRIRDRTASRGF